MTLIVGFKCGDSAVLCADSQETRGGHKIEIDKLPIHRGSGTMDLACGGAGHGELTDRFRSALIIQFDGSTLTGEAAIHRVLEDALVAFHNSSVFRAFPASDPNEKLIAGLVAVRTVAHEVLLFKYMGTVVQPVTTYGLAGEEYTYLERFASNRYRSGLSVHQAVLLGIEIVTEAKATSVYVGGSTRVVITTPSEGMRSEEHERIAWTEAEIATQNRLFDALRFELSSTKAETQHMLQTFANSITSMKHVYGSRYPAWPKPTLGDTEDD